MRQVRIILSGTPSFVHPLEMAPKEAEKQIQSGRWLILSFAAWSVPDIQSIGDALREAKKHEGKIRLGLRPFSGSKEMLAWIPGYFDSGDSPVWMVLEDGKVIAVIAGKLSNQDLEALTSRAPNGLLKDLKPDDLADLYAYLKSLKP